MIQATQGQVTSPNFPRPYPSDSDCTLTIDGGDSVKFKVKFEFFQVEEDEDGKIQVEVFHCHSYFFKNLVRFLSCRYNSRHGKHVRGLDTSMFESWYSTMAKCNSSFLNVLQTSKVHYYPIMHS